MIKTKRTNQPYDKIFRKLLSDKKQVVEILNQQLPLKEKITEEEIERYPCKFVNTQFENRESDMIYKFKNANLFFLIEHQSRIDYNMAQRIAEYQVEIMRLENPKTKNQKEITIPLIIPLVIYTSRKAKWNAKKSIKEMQPKIKGYRNQSIGEYRVLDINLLKMENILHSNILMLRVFGLEKAETAEEMVNVLEYILYTEEDAKNIEILKEIVHYVYGEIFEDKEIMKEFEKKEGKDHMSFVDMLLEEKESWIKQGKQSGRQEGRKEGRKEEKLQIAKQLLKLGMKQEDIEKATKLTAEEIEKLGYQA